MIEMPRLGIFINDKCNLKCKYCNNFSKGMDFTITKEFLTFLANLTVSYAVIICGKEPLLDFKKIQKIFSHVPQHIHKKVVTNGTLLTSKRVDYFNNTDVEVSISHDGETTEFTRGVDILKIKKLCDLVKSIKNLSFQACINTISFNTKILSYQSDILNRDDFIPILLVDVSSSLSVLPMFYKYNICIKPHENYLSSPWYKNTRSQEKALPCIVQYTPNGKIWLSNRNEFLCNIDDPILFMNKKLLSSKYQSYCANHVSLCKSRTNCVFNPYIPNELYCRYVEKSVNHQLRSQNVI